MRIRSQLILAAFVLAVIPLAAIVTYSYHSSRSALEAAYRDESDRLTRQMDRRLTAIRSDLDQRLTVVSSLPLPSSESEVESSIVTVMGDAAELVDGLEFRPLRLARSLLPAAKNAGVDTAPEAEPEVADAGGEAGLAADQAPQIAQAPPAAPRPPPAPIMIDLPQLSRFPQFVMAEEHKELIDELARLGRALNDRTLDPEERQDLHKELEAAQAELRTAVASGRQKFEQAVQEAIHQERIRVAARKAERERRATSVSQVARVAPVPVPAPAPAVTATPVVAGAPQAAQASPAPRANPLPPVRVRPATKQDVEASAITAKKTSLILGRKFEAPVRKEGEVVGQLTARISPEEVVRRVLGQATEDGLEVPFAYDREQNLYTRTSADRSQLERLGVPERLREGRSLSDIDGWIVTTSTDPQSGLRIGVARPVGQNLDALRRTAARNFSLGIGLIAFALIGIVPLSNHLTRDVKLVTEGAERIAHGDLMTRLPVKTNNELGQLARAFNRMAEDLSVQQQRLVEQERARKEQELQQRLMAVEYERKSVELEDARRFQLSMLPKELPQHPAFDVGVYTRTATEVGGDYYDFHLAGDRLAVTIGDATGHGAKAGTMVTVVKTLFSGYQPDMAPAAFLADAAEKIKRMDLGRMAMALSLGRIEPGSLTLSSAGMPPVLVHRAAQRTVEEVAISATPLGTMGTTYEEATVALSRGDTILFQSDGFPELMNDAGMQLGYGAALDAFTEAAQQATAAGVIESMARFSAQWHGEAAPNDDVTFVVVRML